MTDNIIFEIFIYYFLQENNFKILNNLKLICTKYNDNIKNDIYYQRKKSAYLLHNTIKKMDIDYNDISNFIYNMDKYDFKYIINNIYNIYSNADITYNNYKRTIYLYKYDNLNPLKRLPIFKKNEIKEKMKSNIMLNMALDHAEKQFSFNVAREIDDYYYF